MSAACTRPATDIENAITATKSFFIYICVKVNYLIHQHGISQHANIHNQPLTSQSFPHFASPRTNVIKHAGLIARAQKNIYVCKMIPSVKPKLAKCILPLLAIYATCQESYSQIFYEYDSSGNMILMSTGDYMTLSLSEDSISGTIIHSSVSPNPTNGSVIIKFRCHTLNIRLVRKSNRQQLRYKWKYVRHIRLQRRMVHFHLKIR